MRKRPLSLFASALLFLYFPIEFLLRTHSAGGEISMPGLALSVGLPLILLFGLIRVTRVGWYTLVAMVALWGIRDLFDYYMTRGSSIYPLLTHLAIYAFSLAYFINPRIRHLYFDPKLRWWRTKRRFETHLPFILSYKDEWHYPILRDISEGGCFIETHHPLDINSKVQLSIPLPEPTNLSVIRAEGEVRWISRNPARFGMGVQFTDNAPQDARALRDYVKRHIFH